MIGYLRGVIISKKGEHVVIDVNGVGYDVLVPSSFINRLPKEKEITELRIYTHVREDQLQLFGFFTESERELFQLLISVSGIGPRTAMAIVSEISPHVLTQIILTKNIKQLTSIPGIGRKTAERLVLELQEKIQKISSDPSATDNAPLTGFVSDLRSALSNLGYRDSHVDRVLTQLRGNMNEKMSFEELLRKSLQILRS